MKTRFKVIASFILVILFFNFTFLPKPNQNDWNEETPVYQVLIELGETPPKHYQKNPSQEQIKQGKELVLNGRTIGPDGRKTNYISKYYVCTNCHNTVQEDPDIRFSNPETRLDYVSSKNLPFLQGTTFWGIVNRETWYNDDYVKKYGDLVVKANQDLGESIQLCAQECSQGRKLKDWEVEAITAYYWSLQLKMGDLNLTKNDWEKLKNQNKNPAKAASLRKWLKGFYALKSPATFANVPSDKSKGYGLKGHPEKGKRIYESSCLECHNAQGVSDFVLDNSKFSFKKLANNINTNTYFSIYKIIREGTYAQPGHKPYMPHFPLERMSHQQIEDLRSFIEQEAS